MLNLEFCFSIRGKIAVIKIVIPKPELSPVWVKYYSLVELLTMLFILFVISVTIFASL